MTGLTLSPVFDVGGLLTLLTLLPIIGVIARAHARYVLKGNNRQTCQWARVTPVTPPSVVVFPGASAYERCGDPRDGCDRPGLGPASATSPAASTDLETGPQAPPRPRFVTADVTEGSKSGADTPDLQGGTRSVEAAGRDARLDNAMARQGIAGIEGSLAP